MRTFAFDLDFTLLDRNRNIGPDTRKTLFERHKDGDMIVFATSRPKRSINRFLDDELRNIATLITQNGSVIYKSDELQERTLLGGFTAGLIATLRKDKDVRISVETNGLEFGCNATYTDEDLWEIQSATREMMLPLDAIDPADVTKVGVYGYVDDITYLLPTIQAAGCYGIPCEENRFINIVNPSVDKSLCLERIVKSLPDNEATYAFGDDVPDIRMLSLPDVHGVAMGNAFDEVKAAADEVIGDCDADCIGEYIRRII